jgi:hypothetical protein
MSLAKRINPVWIDNASRSGSTQFGADEPRKADQPSLALISLAKRTKRSLVLMSLAKRINPVWH